MTAPLELLSREDKWYLGAGEGLVWAPPFPAWLDAPGFWDEAHVFEYPLAPLFTVAFVDDAGKEIPLRARTWTWTPAALEVSYDGVPRLAFTEARMVLPGFVLGSEWQIVNTGGQAVRLHAAGRGTAPRAAGAARARARARHRQLGRDPLRAHRRPAAVRVHAVLGPLGSHARRPRAQGRAGRHLGPRTGVSGRAPGDRDSAGRHPATGRRAARGAGARARGARRAPRGARAQGRHLRGGEPCLVGGLLRRHGHPPLQRSLLRALLGLPLVRAAPQRHRGRVGQLRGAHSGGGHRLFPPAHRVFGAVPPARAALGQRPGVGAAGGARRW